MNRHPLRKKLGAEEGSILLIVLGFTVVFGLIMAAIFSNAGANLRNTANVRSSVGKSYSGDAGIDWGLQRIRNDDTLCPNGLVAPVGSPLILPGAPDVGGRTPTVTCEVVSGSVAGLGGWAVVTTGPAPSFETTGPAPFQKKINGPVWTSGFQPGTDLHDLKVTDGDVYEQAGGSTCTVDADKPPNLSLSPSPPFAYYCDSRSVATILAGIPSTRPTLTDLAPQNPTGVSTSGGCRVFEPGVYTSLNLEADNYFRSGVYYFVNAGLIDVRALQLVGGTPSVDEADPTTNLTPCGSDTASQVGTGVKFILGGDSRIEVRNPSGRMELFSRRGGPAWEGAQDISIQTVAADWSADGWLPSSLSVTGDPVLDVGLGNTTKMVIRGGVYAPNAKLSLDPTNGAVAHLLGGVVVGHLEVRQQATTDGLLLSVRTGNEAREIRLISKVVDGDRQIVSTAMIEIENDDARTLTMKSWRTSCQLSGGSPCPHV